jgi:hypothetical protein
LTALLGVQRLGYDEFAIIRNGMVLRAYDAPVLSKSMFAVFVDAAIVALAAVAAVALKTDFEVAANRHEALGMIATLVPVAIAVFWQMGLYRGTWRLASIDDFVRASCSVLIASLLGMTLRMILTLSSPGVALFSIFALVATVLVTGTRASYQILAASRWRSAGGGMPALIYGAGRKGASALRELVADPSATLRPVAFIDDDPSKDGRMLNGIPIVGSIGTIERAIRRLAIRAVVVASDALPALRLSELGELCERSGVALLEMRVTVDSLGSRPGPAVSAAAAMGLWSHNAMAAAEAVSAETAAPATFAVAADEAPAFRIRFEDARAAAGSLPLMAGEHCPKCASARLHRSHVRKMTERVRKHLTDKRLFRCETCGWRGWNAIVDPAAHGPFPLTSAPLIAERASAAH